MRRMNALVLSSPVEVEAFAFARQSRRRKPPRLMDQ